MRIRARSLSIFVFISSLLMMRGAFAPEAARGASTADLTLTVRVIPDGVPPGDITNLKAVKGSQDGQIDLTWTSPGDNGFANDLINGSYRIQYATVPLAAFIDPANIVIATNAVVLSTQGYTVQGLTPGDTYYFAMIALDQYGNRSVWSTGGGRNPESFARAGFTPGIPNPVIDLTALPGGGEGDVDLSWTAPGANYVPIVSYEVRYATFSAASVGSTTTWAAGASRAAYAPTQATGGVETRTISTLFPGATWYFSIQSINSAGASSHIDLKTGGPLQASAMPRSLPPGTPTGLGAAAGVLRIVLSWSDLTGAARGLDFSHYRVERSTNAVDYVALATTTAASYTDLPLRAMATYFYRLIARDLRGNESAATAAVSAVPYTLLPMEPIGVKVVPSSTTMSLSWSATSRFFDGTPFVSTGTPSGDELIGYSVYRSTDICDPYFVNVASLTTVVTAMSDSTGGLNYYYRLFSYNSLGVSTNAVTISSLGERNYMLEDCASTLVIDDATAASLNGDVNGQGDIRIQSASRPQDVGNAVFQSGEWKAELNGTTEIKNFVLPKPARVVLRFGVSGGKAVPASAPSRNGSAAAAVPSAGVPIGDLGVFWYNGAEYKKMYGRVDPVAQTVTAESPNLGIYQIRAQARSDGAVFDLSNLSGRVITPNGDGLNDVAIFSYDPGPRNISAEGRVFDARGSAVAEMIPGLVPNTLTWDGRMNGRPATSGVYVYRITGDGKTFTGTIVVAR